MKIKTILSVYLNINGVDYKIMKVLQNLKDINEAIDQSTDNIVLIDCYTKWCGPCKRLTPSLEKLQEEYITKNQKVIFCKLDIEQEDVKEWVSMKDITSIPTIFIIKDKKDVSVIEGADIIKIKDEIEINLNTN